MGTSYSFTAVHCCSLIEHENSISFTISFTLGLSGGVLKGWQAFSLSLGSTLLGLLAVYLKLPLGRVSWALYLMLPLGRGTGSWDFGVSLLAPVGI